MSKLCKGEPKKKKSWKKRLFCVLLALTLFCLTVISVLQIGVWYSARSWQHWYADYPMQDITALLSKSDKTQEDYDVLYAQTGLTKLGVDGLLKKTDGVSTVLEIQRYYFSKPTVRAEKFNPFTYLEVVDGSATFCSLENGDILLSATTRVSWFRYGHAAIVVDAEKNLIVESTVPDTKSTFNLVSSFDYLANFLVLRPKADKNTRDKVAAYAKENLVGVKYNLTAGLFTKKYGNIRKTGSHCAHLVWYAYKAFGIDLDYNGGLVVRPQEIARSPKVELVQNFGFHPTKLWS